MEVVQVDVRSRAFVLQFFEIMREFDSEIPWLHRLKGITYATNPTYFRDQLLLRLGCDEGEIVPYQLLDSAESKEFIGGLLHFPLSPERFQDKTNQAVLEQLAYEQYRYISCLQIRHGFRKYGYGNIVMRATLDSILEHYKKVWGVISDPQLLAWYVSLGGCMLSPWVNADKLWIIAWDSLGGEVRIVE